MKVSKNFGVMKSTPPTIGGFIVTNLGCFFKVKCFLQKDRLVKWDHLNNCPFAQNYKYCKNLRITSKSVSWHIKDEKKIQKAKLGIFYEL